MKLDFHSVSKIHNRKKQQYSLKDVSISFKELENIAIIARNESSSIAMLNLIAGIERPTRGVINRKGIFTGIIGESSYFHPELSGEESIRFICKVYGQNTNEVMANICEFAEIKDELKQKNKTHNNLLRRRIALSTSLLMKSDIYLLSGAVHHVQKQFNQKIQKKLLELSKQATMVIEIKNQDLMKKYASASIVIDDNGYLEKFEDIESGINAHNALKEAPNDHAI